MGFMESRRAKPLLFLTTTCTMGYQEKYHNAIHDKISDYCQVDMIANPQDRYLRDVAVKHNGFLKPELDALRNHQLEETESDICKCISKLLTKASLLLCENGMLTKFHCENHTDLRSKNPTMRNALMRSCLLGKWRSTILMAPS